MADQEEEYERALEALSSLISGKQRKDGSQWAHAFEMMASYLECLGLDAELPNLSIIHVAGTKGKGSTCAMIERMLRSAGYRTGLFTSPHLVDVRERIRINGEPVDKESFLHNLWWCFNTLAEKAGDDSGKPAYFRFLTLLGLKVFLEKQVDVVILEVGLGGRLDATNCVRQPVVCGVSSLGFDHMEVLGHTLPEIAREKAGIFKPGVPAFTVPQREDAAATLRERAAAVGAPLTVVRPWEAYQGSSAVRLGLAGDHQKLNAALALALAGTWEATAPVAAAVSGEAAAQRAAEVAAGRLPAEYVAGLEAASWPGRGQIIHDIVEPAAAAAVEAAEADAGQSGEAASAASEQQQGQPQQLQPQPRLSFFLDGAHTAESMETCANWFADAIGQQPTAAAAASAPAAPGGTGQQQAAAPAVQPQGSSGGLVTQRVLLFNCMQERDPQKLLAPLAATLAERQVSVQHALFVPPDSTYMKLGASAEPPNLSWQHSLRSVWDSHAGGSSSNGSASLANGGARSCSSAAAAAGRAAITLPPLPAVPSPGAAAGAAQAAGLTTAAAGAARSAVLPSLAVTLDWLRRCVREAPSLRMQVLVTGSLYLVGDLLKHLQNEGSGSGGSGSKA
ncbi:folylpolyglutamate synthase isoform X1 [Chlorella sorokiniana]|uniref:Folylpolyglutamate synthase n=1 Tax=Chlorella sorokiniana TaxID=3076 RepID=A0A2P6TI73_CHLSO|nr:folylpolyglutamate synthase isoform X1 [Chlorella sorokiniana]|eukprot:PRW33995.1 folylpolyglutamate synthase isoform X1 [Chlorella sorokiniana]